MHKLLLTIILSLACRNLFAQLPQVPAAHKEYVIGGVKIVGTQYLDASILVHISKLNQGNKIIVPSDETAGAIKNLWNQHLFDDIALHYTTVGDSIYFEIKVTELPRLTKTNLKGIGKLEAEDIQKKLQQDKGKVVNNNLIQTITAVIKKYFIDKGFFNTTVRIKPVRDTAATNSQILDIHIDKKSKVRVKQITFEGMQGFQSGKLKSYLKNTKEKKWYHIFGSKKFIPDKFEEDKYLLVKKIRNQGYRDAQILGDSVWTNDEKTVSVKIKLYEGPKYYFGDITWSGNATYTSEQLNQQLKIKKGSIFSEDILNERLNGPTRHGDDIASLYLDNGYLTYKAEPVEKLPQGNVVDWNIYVYEGPQYTINRVLLKGNTITNDKVVMRQLRTKPGQQFSKEKIVRSVREIAQLGFFDETKIDPKPININPNEGTVDLVYHVVEKSSDQFSLSGGYGNKQFIGSVGLSFGNFSIRNIFNPKAYTPLPRGDGEKLSLQMQSNIREYSSYTISFSNPWFGERKPILFGLTAYRQQTRGTQTLTEEGIRQHQSMRRSGMGVNLGKQLQWPDDYFSLSHSLSFDQYRLTNFPMYVFPDGTSYNIKWTSELSRNSLDAPIYPTSGTHIRLTLQLTPPYSLFNKLNYGHIPHNRHYKFIEYHKEKFEAQWFHKIYGQLVVRARVQFGFLGYYKQAVGIAPVERFSLGGDGMQNTFILQNEMIGLRGYNENAFDHDILQKKSNNRTVHDRQSGTHGFNRDHQWVWFPQVTQQSGSPIFSKYTLELRHPLVMNNQFANVYLLAFLEAGNTWRTFQEFSPFNVRRSVGVGIRIFLPMLGMLGLDYGLPLDKVPGLAGGGEQRVTFTIGQSPGGFN